MKNLIAFLKRFQIFLVFIVLQVVALTTYSAYSEFTRLQILTTTSAVNSQLFEVRHAIDKHFYLESSNRSLVNKNKYLLEQLKNAHYRVDKGKVYIDDTLYKQIYSYLPAEVIQNTYDKRNNYMTIDIGRKDGVQKNDGVFSAKGVVGKIHYVGENYSLVKTVLSQNVNIDVMLQKTGAFGFVKWDANHPKIIQITGISNDITIKKFEKVITYGSSGIFPKGIPVGRVLSKKHIEGKPLYDIQVRIFEDFRTIQHVYVVKNTMKKEILALQNHIPKDKEEKVY